MTGQDGGTGPQDPFVPGFNHDIFISYAHIDNLVDDPDLDDRGWVDRFQQRLKVQLCKRLGETVKIWRDDTDLKRSDRISPAIGAAIHRAAVYLVLISNRSLISDSCREEFSLIAQAVAADPLKTSADTQARVFSVLLYNIPHEAWPTPCRGMPGFHFYTGAEDGRAGRPLDPRDDRAAYQRQFDQLIDELSDLLRKLRARRTPPPYVRSQIYRVLVTAAPGTRLLDREHLTRVLRDDGIEVLPHTVPPPYRHDEHAAKLQELLTQTDMSLHLVDYSSGGEVEGGDGNRCYPEEQCRVAYMAGGTQLVILPEAIDLASVEVASHRSFIKQLLDGHWPNPNPGERLTIARARQPEAIAELVRRARERHFLPPPIQPLQPGGLAFVDTTLRDLIFVSQLFEFLEQRDLKPITMPTSDDSPQDYQAAFAENVARSAALIIVYGHVKRSWVKARLQRASNLIIERDLRVNPVVYVAPPPKTDADVEFRQCAVADCRGGFNEQRMIKALAGHS